MKQQVVMWSKKDKRGNDTAQAIIDLEWSEVAEREPAHAEKTPERTSDSEGPGQ